MPPQDSLSTPTVTPPTGYSLVLSNGKPVPRKLKDLMAEASSRKPILPPAGYVLDPYATKALTAIRNRNQPTGSLSASPEPSALEQLRMAIENSAVGYSVETALPKVADALGLHPTETVNSPTYTQHKEQLIAPEYAAPLASTILNAQSPVPLTQSGEERLEGGLRGLGGFTTAPSLAMLAAGPLAAPTTAAGATLSRLVSGGFTLDMLHSLYQQHKQYREAVDKGDLAEAHRIQGEMGVTGIMDFLSAKHALTKHPITPIDTRSDTPSRERTNVLHRNTAGEVRQAKGQAPTVWLSPDAWQSLMGELYPEEDHNATHGFNLPANNDLLDFATKHQPATPSPMFTDVQQLLAKAHENTGQGGMAIGKQRPSLQANVNVMREELNHTWQRGLTGKITDHLSPDGFTRMYQAIPSGLYDHLIEHGYSGYNSPEMVAEAAVRMMDGRPEKFGVTNDEAVDFLDKYFKEVTDKHGAKALEELQHVRGVAADAKTRAIEEHGRTGAGQDNRTVSSVGVGGQGGVGEGVPAEGGQVTPAAPHEPLDAEIQKWNEENPFFNREKDDPDSQMALFRQMGEKLKEARNNYSANKPETVAAYNEALRNYEFSSPSFMRRYMREQMGQIQKPGDVADVQELERMSKLGETLFNREKDKPIWYLKSERLIGEKMRGPMPGQDLHKMLLAGGVKPEEMHWTGLDDFLKSKGKEKVTPEEIREHLANNNIQIKEVQKVPDSGHLKSNLVSQYNTFVDVAKKSLGIQAERVAEDIESGTDPETAIKQFDPNPSPELLQHGKILYDTGREVEKARQAGPTKFSNWVLPGGENYRELLLTLAPDTPKTTEIKRQLNELTAMDADVRQYKGEDRRAAYDRLQKELVDAGGSWRPQLFKSKHWDEPNPLAHIRFNDRTGPDGERLLHVEEIQSDWGQSIRDNGAQDPQRLSELREQLDAIRKKYDTSPTPQDIRDWRAKGISDDEINQKLNDQGIPADQYQKMRDEQRPIENEIDKLKNAPPKMPLAKTWHEAALRRALKYAAENGYSGVSWTGGEDQNARYNLSKQVKKIAVPMVNENGTRSVRIEPIDGGHSFNMMVAPDGTVDGTMYASQFTGKKLDEVVGKEMAQRIMDAKEPTDFEGEGLNVGGSGMRGFYDKIVPDYLNKFGKKFGAKVGETEFPVPGDKRITIRRGINGWDVESRLDENIGREHGLAFFSDEDYGGKEGAQKAAQKDAEERSAPRKKVQYLPITPEMRKSVTEEGVPLFNREITKTPEFKQWFGESKVVDKDGEPMVLYHGTPADFTEFGGPLMYFSNDPNYTEYFSGRGASVSGQHPKTIPAYVKMENPLDARPFGLGKISGNDFLKAVGAPTTAMSKSEAMGYRDERPFWSWLRHWEDNAPDFLRAKGYDGVIQEENLGDKKTTAWVAIDPTQIKSALGNSGSFDPKDPNILRHREMFNPAAPDKNTPSEDGYLYHATNHYRASDIANQGLLLHKPGEFTDQDVWPDGSTKKRSYFTPKASSAHSFLPEDGKGALLRVKRDDRFKDEQYTGDVYSHSVIPPKDLEILGEDGKWTPISQAYPKDEASFNREKSPNADNEENPHDLPLNSDGTVTLYHGTTKDGADAIAKTGKLKSAGEPDVYLTTAKEGTGYGDGTVVAVRVDPSKLLLDDEFPDGRKDFRIDAGKPGGSVDIKLDTPSAAGQESTLDSNSDSKEGAEQSPESVAKGSAEAAPAIPILGNTQLASAPVMVPPVPVPTKKVLPLSQIKVLAAGLAPKSQQGQVKSVRELMQEARSRMVP